MPEHGGDLDQGARAVRRQFVPERDAAPVHGDGLRGTVPGGHDGVPGGVEPAGGGRDFPVRGRFPAGPGDPGYDPAGKPEDCVLAEPDDLGPLSGDTGCRQAAARTAPGPSAPGAQGRIGLPAARQRAVPKVNSLASPPGIIGLADPAGEQRKGHASGRAAAAERELADPRTVGADLGKLLTAQDPAAEDKQGLVTFAFLRHPAHGRQQSGPQADAGLSPDCTQPPVISRPGSYAGFSSITRPAPSKSKASAGLCGAGPAEAGEGLAPGHVIPAGPAGSQRSLQGGPAMAYARGRSLP